mmetsp:Transcript_31338/g.78580  ORF Transcript_31338/g.78580 Transcript_31338/m.78580 type:complete len:524 (+) Transcript_31338:1805-3376(+)
MRYVAPARVPAPPPPTMGSSEPVSTMGAMLAPQTVPVEGINRLKPPACVAAGDATPVPASTRNHRDGAALVASTSTVVPRRVTAYTTLGCHGPVDGAVTATDPPGVAAAAAASSAVPNATFAATPTGANCRIAAAAATAPTAEGHTRTSSSRPWKPPTPLAPAAALDLSNGHALTRVTAAGEYRVLKVSGRSPSWPADERTSARPATRSCDKITKVHSPKVTGGPGHSMAPTKLSLTRKRTPSNSTVIVSSGAAPDARRSTPGDADVGSAHTPSVYPPTPPLPPAAAAAEPARAREIDTGSETPAAVFEPDVVEDASPPASPPPPHSSASSVNSYGTEVKVRSATTAKRKYPSSASAGMGHDTEVPSRSSTDAGVYAPVPVTRCAPATTIAGPDNSAATPPLPRKSAQVAPADELKFAGAGKGCVRCSREGSTVSLPHTHRRNGEAAKLKPVTLTDLPSPAATARSTRETAAAAPGTPVIADIDVGSQGAATAATCTLVAAAANDEIESLTVPAATPVKSLNR